MLFHRGSKLFTLHFKRKHCLRKPGSVLACHLSSPRVTPWLKRSTLHRKSGGQPSDDGIRELAAPSRHSPTITRRLVVSYTTFSPLPRASLQDLRGGRSLLPSPAVTNSFHFQKWGALCCPDFPLPHPCSGSATSRGSVFACKGTKISRKYQNFQLILSGESWGQGESWGLAPL